MVAIYVNIHAKKVASNVILGYAINVRLDGFYRNKLVNACLIVEMG